MVLFSKHATVCVRFPKSRCVYLAVGVFLWFGITPLAVRAFGTRPVRRAADNAIARINEKKSDGAKLNRIARPKQSRPPALPRPAEISETPISKWRWSEHAASPFYCAKRYNGKYSVRVLRRATDRFGLVIEISHKKGSVVHAWRGHEHSVFQIIGDRLYYAIYGRNSFGGQVVAIDLSTGKHLWARSLKALQLNVSFGLNIYHNRLNLNADDNSVWVFGKEAFGRYAELFRARNGELMSAKLLEPKCEQTRIKSLIALNRLGARISVNPDYSVKYVHMRSNKITDADLVHLASLKNLTLLSLHSTKISDSGLKHLAGLSKLEHLMCSSPQISDNGLKHLKSLPVLRRLWLQNTNVTDEGVKLLRAALPKCRVLKYSRDSRGDRALFD